MIRKQESPAPLFYPTQEIALAPRHAFYVRLRTALDWQALAAPFAPAFCQERGRPTDPAVYLKIFLVGSLEDITYDTRLADRIADSLSIREFLGYSLSELPPEHSSISRNRARIGVASSNSGEHCQVEEILERVVELCAQAGLVGGEELAVDASLKSLQERSTGERVREYMRKVREHNQVAKEAGEPLQKPQVSNERFRSTTDGDARIVQKRGTRRGLYYRATHLTDAKAGIIVEAGVTTADGGEAEAAQPLVTAALTQLQALPVGAEEQQASPPVVGGTGCPTCVVVADAGYDAAAFHAGIEAAGGVPLTNFQADSSHKPAAVKKATFLYIEEADCYLCPAGRLLRCVKAVDSGRDYASDPKECLGCQWWEGCVSRWGWRGLHRGRHEASRERNIARCHTEAGRAALKRRKHIVEPPFGHLKTYGGLSRITCRGQKKARVKVVLAAVAWDLIKLVKALAKAASESAAALAALQSGSERLLGALMGCPGGVRRRRPQWRAYDLSYGRFHP